MSGDERPIVVGGCHRSGTSLVRRILDAHSRIHCGTEVPFFRDFYGDYLDDPLAHLRFATSARQLLPESELLEVLGQGFIELHRRAADQAGKPRWADKAPENVLYTREWETLLGDRWLFVHVVRSPLDTLASMAETGFPLTLPADLKGRIEWYRRYTEAGLAFGAEHPGRYRRVVYEALCESPEQVVGDLMRGLGEAPEQGQLELGGRPSAGLEDPKIAATAGVHRESVGRWERRFSPDEAKLIRSATAQVWSRIEPAGVRGPGKEW